MGSDCYAVLGVDRSAGEDEIRRAYRRLAAKLHPDRNPGDRDAERRFKEVSAAYVILIDADKRRAYDQGGAVPSTPRPGQTFRAGPTWVRRNAKKTGPVRVDPFKAAMRPGAVYTAAKPVKLGPVPVVTPPMPDMPEVPLFTKGRAR